jgi:hypothetical protein
VGSYACGCGPYAVRHQLNTITQDSPPRSGTATNRTPQRRSSRRRYVRHEPGCPALSRAAEDPCAWWHCMTGQTEAGGGCQPNNRASWRQTKDGVTATHTGIRKHRIRRPRLRSAQKAYKPYNASFKHRSDVDATFVGDTMYGHGTNIASRRSSHTQ